MKSKKRSVELLSSLILLCGSTGFIDLSQQIPVNLQRTYSLSFIWGILGLSLTGSASANISLCVGGASGCGWTGQLPEGTAPVLGCVWWVC